MIINNAKRKRLLATFSDQANNFLDNIDQLVLDLVSRWGLTDLELIEDDSVNFLFYAKSSSYDDVVLKIGAPHKELFSEAVALKYLKNDIVCECYEFDKKTGSKLLERIQPGISLEKLDRKSDQLNIALKLIPQVPKLAGNTTSLPTYKDWLENTFRLVTDDSKIRFKLDVLIHNCEKFFDYLEFDKQDLYVLHGDLHHKNILKSVNNWKIIDPQGVIGLKFMESARFLNNHLFFYETQNLKQELEEGISLFVEAFGTSKLNIGISLLLINTLTVCWFCENSNPDVVLVNYIVEGTIDLIKFLLKLI